MTKQKTRIISKYPLTKRTTYKKHSKRYAKVYAPYLPAVVGLIVGASIFISDNLNRPNFVLSYATATSSDSLLSETNERRQDYDAGELSLNKELSTAAQMKADDMATNDYWSHATPDGKQPWDFIDQAGYSYSEAAENLAYGFISSKDTVNGWMNSPEHRRAMLDKDFSEVGFGIANAPDYQRHGPETIVVALYGKPRHPAPNQINASFTSEPAKSISRGQLWTGGKLPWINLALGITIGLTAMYLITKHSLKLRKKLRQGEQYVLAHPALDVGLICLLLVMLLLSRTVGFIH